MIDQPRTTPLFAKAAAVFLTMADELGFVHAEGVLVAFLPDHKPLGAVADIPEARLCAFMDACRRAQHRERARQRALAS